MEMANSWLAWLNETGLLLAVVGGVIIFIWGPPQPSFQAYAGLALEPGNPMPDGGTAGDIEPREKRRKRTY
jgi:hypothetical protein